MIHQVILDVLTDNTPRRIVSDATPAVAAEKKEAPKSPAKAKRATPIRKLEQIKCPVCGQGHLLKGRAAYGCSRYAEGCTLRLPFDVYPADLTPGKLNAAIKNKFKTQ